VVARRAVISASLSVAPGVTIAFGDQLEVSLDCPNCKRKRRTVIFNLGGRDGRCTPVKNCGMFPGRLTDKRPSQRTNTFSVDYVVEYQYEPFLDLKYGDESTGAPSWARVHFMVKCPRCSREKDWSTQNNIVRPWSHVCDCGQMLYTEEQEIPLLQWHAATAT
jgi:hypothetical protein